MKAHGYIFTTKYKNVDYYFKPTEYTWVKDVKKISVGDIYFTDIPVKLYMGGSPRWPTQNAFPELDSDLWEKKEFTITTNII